MTRTVVATLLLTGCDGRLTGSGSGESDEASSATSGVVTYADVKPILDGKCGGACHSPTGVHRIDLESYGPARISGHAILRVIKGSMPPQSSGLVLTADEITKLELWGDSGFLEKGE